VFACRDLPIIIKQKKSTAETDANAFGFFSGISFNGKTKYQENSIFDLKSEGIIKVIINPPEGDTSVLTAALKNWSHNTATFSPISETDALLLS